MHRPLFRGHKLAPAGLALALAAVFFSGGADGGAGAGFDLETLAVPARHLADRAAAWYHKTPPADRLTWGGLAACAGLGLGVMFERMLRLRQRRIVPRDFATRFLGRLQDGKLDRGKALDFCELNPSPAARVALGAVRRWDRPVSDQERAVTMTCRVEADQLRRHVGTLRRIAAMAPLIGLLGSLLSAGRVLSGIPAGGMDPGWGPTLATALTPVTAGVGLAILALVAYDGLMGRIEKLVGMLERHGTETVDAIAMMAPPASRVVRTPHLHRSDVVEPHVRLNDRNSDRERMNDRAADRNIERDRANDRVLDRNSDRDRVNDRVADRVSDRDRDDDFV